MNLKIRINLIVTVVLALAMLIGAWMMIENARDDIRAEVDSTTVIALHLLDAEISHYANDARNQARNGYEISPFSLQSLDNIRHLRIVFFDANGMMKDSNKTTVLNKENAPPVWFEKLINTVSPRLNPTHRSIVVNEKNIGELVITPDPSYEIAEIWHDTYGLFSLGLVFFFIVNALLYWAVNSALQPLHKILIALTEIELGHLDARLPIFKLPELSNISKKFNTMAQTLESSMSNNNKLTQKIIRLQEDERKGIAQDLHDEIGQHLTAINIDAAAILKAKDIHFAHKSAAAISTVVMQMMTIVSEMLHRLRPATLDELGLTTALQELIETWRQRNKSIKVTFVISDKLESVNETIKITAYRIVQECLTNVAKHANAHLVTIKIEIKDELLHIFIRDDGRGFTPNQNTLGLGLIGMRERVEGLGGALNIYTQENTGVSVMVFLPIHFKGLS